MTMKQMGERSRGNFSIKYCLSEIYKLQRLLYSLRRNVQKENLNTLISKKKIKNKSRAFI